MRRCFNMPEAQLRVIVASAAGEGGAVVDAREDNTTKSLTEAMRENIQGIEDGILF